MIEAHSTESEMAGSSTFEREDGDARRRGIYLVEGHLDQSRRGSRSPLVIHPFPVRPFLCFVLSFSKGTMAAMAERGLGAETMAARLAE